MSAVIHEVIQLGPQNSNLSTTQVRHAHSLHKITAVRLKCLHTAKLQVTTNYRTSHMVTPLNSYTVTQFASTVGMITVRRLYTSTHVTSHAVLVREGYVPRGNTTGIPPVYPDRDITEAICFVLYLYKHTYIYIYCMFSLRTSARSPRQT